MSNAAFERRVKRLRQRYYEALEKKKNQVNNEQTNEETQDETEHKENHSNLTKDEIKAKLDELEVEYDSKANKADLFALLEEATKSGE